MWDPGQKTPDWSLSDFSPIIRLGLRVLKRKTIEGKLPSCDIMASTHTGNIIVRLGVNLLLALLLSGFSMDKLLFSFFYAMLCGRKSPLKVLLIHPWGLGHASPLSYSPQPYLYKLFGILYSTSVLPSPPLVSVSLSSISDQQH